MSADRPTIYRKFSGSRGVLFGVHQLWAAEDHLLLVRANFGFERYQRFYFQDIEAFIMHPTGTQRGWIIANALIFAAFAGLALLAVSGEPTAGEKIGGLVLVGIGALFLLFLIYHIVRGPTCASFLQMRTGLERLKVAGRLRGALHLRDRLAALLGAWNEAKAASSRP